MPHHQQESDQVVRHIPSEHSKEMASKSVVVSIKYEVLCTLHTVLFCIQIPLGIQLLNENKLSDMSQLMDHFHNYVPTLEAEGCYTLPDGNFKFDDTRFFCVPGR